MASVDTIGPVLKPMIERSVLTVVAWISVYVYSTLERRERLLAFVLERSLRRRGSFRVSSVFDDRRIERVSLFLPVFLPIPRPFLRSETHLFEIYPPLIFPLEFRLGTSIKKNS